MKPRRTQMALKPKDAPDLSRFDWEDPSVWICS